ncbi:helix-turn-helix domain-containing protein [Bacteroides finegoldii]|uniref:helix-turn-helix domain-containing protein n=1 Tax=Bacteroides finegoldii TaxID=338188 RepID=UPI001897A56D|nr:helix-turn-helix domain-containing protein [Bacteroides finegoldii]
MNIDGYTLTEKMRKARRRFRFTATEQALFYELVAICNGEDWRDVFDCSNIELCFALNVNEKTLIKARESLINAGLIYYKSGKNKRVISSYSFVKEFKTTVTTTVNFTANQTANDTGDSTVVKGVNNTGDSTDYNKLKQKPNKNILSKVSHGDFDFISTEFLETFILWLEYKKDRRENYKSEKSLKACYNKLVKLSKGNPEIASQIINEAIANNWAGFFELKNNKNGNGNKNQTDSTDSGDTIIRTTIL